MAAASAALERRRGGALLTRGILVTVHDLYGGKLPLLPLEMYFQVCRNHDVQPFRYRPRTQVRRCTHTYSSTAASARIMLTMHCITHVLSACD